MRSWAARMLQPLPPHVNGPLRHVGGHKTTDPSAVRSLSPWLLSLTRSLPLSMLPGRPLSLLRGLATAASAAGTLPATVCLDEVRGVIRLSGAGLVHFLQVSRPPSPPPPPLPPLPAACW